MLCIIISTIQRHGMEINQNGYKKHELYKN